MFKVLACGLLISSLLLSVSAIDSGYGRCNCDEEGFWSVDNILEYQRASDFLIAVAYFSIPIELLYFVSCSNVPFKWVLFEFIAFIVLCGLTHLLNGWTYAPHTFQLMLALTIAKFLTALVSCATAITLVTLIPLLLKVKVRELFLKKKAWELDREVGMMKKQKEASLHVRMLTQEIRKSIDRHTILYTTLVELSKTLDLQNCAVWMPNENKTEMYLTHELKVSSNSYCNSIRISDQDVQRVKDSRGVKILGAESALGIASSGGSGEQPGPVAAIRMPMLRISNFKGGTPELIQQCYAILVLVLPNTPARVWTLHELEIVEVVADQVAVALSHAAILEESQLMREKLEEQNQALLLARKNAMMASQARNLFQKVMSHGMRRPMHSISGLLSVLQHENKSSEQQVLIEAMLKISTVLSTLINDVMEISNTDRGRFPLEMRSFRLHSMLKEAACLAKCLCVWKGLDFRIEVENSLPDWVLGDERRIFQVILHMFGNLLGGCHGGESVTFRVLSEIGNEGSNEKQWQVRRPNSSDEFAFMKFEILIHNRCSLSEGSASKMQRASRRNNSEGIEGGLSFSMCKKLVQMMQGNIWILPNGQGLAQSMTLILRFQRQSAVGREIFELQRCSEAIFSEFRGLHVILADDDDVNRAVTKKLLEKLGCLVSAVSSGFECLSALGPSGTRFQIVVLDLHMPEMDGFDVATRIRKLSWSRPLIVALTASADEGLWERCLQAGINGVVRKPFLLQGIADELRRVLQQASTGV